MLTSTNCYIKAFNQGQYLDVLSYFEFIKSKYDTDEEIPAETLLDLVICDLLPESFDIKTLSHCSGLMSLIDEVESPVGCGKNQYLAQTIFSALSVCLAIKEDGLDDSILTNAEFNTLKPQEILKKFTKQVTSAINNHHHKDLLGSELAPEVQCNVNRIKDEIVEKDRQQQKLANLIGRIEAREEELSAKKLKLKALQTLLASKISFDEDTAAVYKKELAELGIKQKALEQGTATFSDALVTKLTFFKPDILINGAQSVAKLLQRS